MRAKVAIDCGQYIAWDEGLLVPARNGENPTAIAGEDIPRGAEMEVSEGVASCKNVAYEYPAELLARIEAIEGRIEDLEQWKLNEERWKERD